MIELFTCISYGKFFFLIFAPWDKSAHSAVVSAQNGGVIIDILLRKNWFWNLKLFGLHRPRYVLQMNHYM